MAILGGDSILIGEAGAVLGEDGSEIMAGPASPSGEDWFGGAAGPSGVGGWGVAPSPSRWHGQAFWDVGELTAPAASGEIQGEDGGIVGEDGGGIIGE